MVLVLTDKEYGLLPGAKTIQLPPLKTTLLLSLGLLEEALRPKVSSKKTRFFKFWVHSRI